MKNNLKPSQSFIAKTTARFKKLPLAGRRFLKRPNKSEQSPLLVVLQKNLVLKSNLIPNNSCF